MSRDGNLARWRRHSGAKYRERRAYMLARLGGRCVICGTTERLEIDHVDPATKHFTLLAEWYRPLEEIDAELEKCQLLCQRDHLAKSRAEGSLARRVGGEEHYQGKLTWAAVREIRAPDQKASRKELAERFGVSRAMIWLVQANRAWRE